MKKTKLVYNLKGLQTILGWSFLGIEDTAFNTSTGDCCTIFTLTLMLLLRFAGERRSKIIIIFHLSILASVHFILYSSVESAIERIRLTIAQYWLFYKSLQVGPYETIFVYSGFIWCASVQRDCING